MRILITGAAGFIGQLLAKELLNDPDHTLILTDITEPPIPQGSKYLQNAKTIKTDLYEESASVIDKSLDAVYLFHGIMSSGAEANFELGMRVNVDATRHILDNIRRICPGVRVIYASSQAVYGLPLPTPVTEAILPLPSTSYGCQKIICETMVNDYTRRGFINGFVLRFPTISVRPGTPTAAASSFISGIIREPLNEEVCIIPLKDRTWRHWMSSPKTLVYNLLIALELSRDSLPVHARQVNVPGFSVTVQDMMDALVEVGGEDKLRFIKEEDDELVKPILYSWPDEFDNSLGLKLGMKQDKSFVRSVLDYKETLDKSRRSLNGYLTASSGLPPATNGAKAKELNGVGPIDGTKAIKV